MTQIIYNQYGFTDTAISSINIKTSANLYVLNSFTPDGDERNQYFTIYGVGIQGYSLQIFNRWGEVISSPNHTEPSWRGDSKGKPCQNGVYTWKLIYIDNEGDE